MLRRVSLVRGAPLVPIAVLEALVACGFPSPSQDYETREIDLVEHLGLRSPTTDLLQQDGSDLESIGIFNGDYLVVDRAATPKDGQIVAATVDGDLVVRRLRRRFGIGVSLLPAHPELETLHLADGADFLVQGVVMLGLHSLLPGTISRKTLSDEAELQQLLGLRHPARYIIRAYGHSMERAGVFSGDEVIVDRARRPEDGQIIVAIVDNEYTLKRLRLGSNSVVYLEPENPAFPSLEIPELSELKVWGVATWSVRHVTAD